MSRFLRPVLIVAMLAGTAARADLFSPGDLAKPHEKLEGISNCTKCHPAGDKLSQEACLAPCHTELKPRILAGKGLHGRLSDDKRACELCHHDHKGRDFQMVDWGAGGKKDFDHRRTGWALKGAHLKAECEKCHERRLITWPVAIKLLEVRPHTFLGLDQACEACHFDEHRGQQKEDCAYCHNEKEWKQVPGFDHDTAEFPLRGKHKKVKCEKCHLPQKDEVKHGFPAPKSETFLKLTNIEFKACTDCHKDPHENRFGSRCGGCHTVDGWNIIHNASKEREFHDKTRYALKGAHLDTDCRACHGPYPGQAAKFKNLKFEECTDCHADAHLGQIATGQKEVDCTACHSVDAFMPAQYGVAQHAKTKYPLEGEHLAVPCDECHEETPALQKKIPQNVLMDLRRKRRRELFSTAIFDFPTPTDKCDTCHDDVHKGQLEKRCDACHQVAGFQKLRFDHQKDSRYPLTGKHEQVKCEKCHFVPPGSRDVVDGKPVVAYRPLEQKCRACHPDEHVGQFVKKGKLADCEDCHTTEDWKKTKFKHELPFTTFLLEGQHEKVPCEKCHAKVALGPKLNPVRYKPMPKKCEGCHVDYHKGAFQGFEP